MGPGDCSSESAVEHGGDGNEILKTDINESVAFSDTEYAASNELVVGGN